MALRTGTFSHYTRSKGILNDLYFKDLSEKYQEALDKLPRQCQNIFRMNRNEGMRSEEIAIALNLSVRTVENQLYRDLKQIKKSMQDYLPVLLLLLVKNFLK
ncbi:MAG: sigma factor-like helix-turn-helix DNA-binding protein [Bacteroides stercoris]